MRRPINSIFLGRKVMSSTEQTKRKRKFVTLWSLILRQFLRRDKHSALLPVMLFNETVGVYPVNHRKRMTTRAWCRQDAVFNGRLVVQVCFKEFNNVLDYRPH